jgi:hypothetical protein
MSNELQEARLADAMIKHNNSDVANILRQDATFSPVQEMTKLVNDANRDAQTFVQGNNQAAAQRGDPQSLMEGPISLNMQPNRNHPCDMDIDIYTSVKPSMQTNMFGNEKLASPLPTPEVALTITNAYCTLPPPQVRYITEIPRPKS